MTPFDHLLAATEQRIATAKAAVSAGRPDDLGDLGRLVRELCQGAIDNRSAPAFDRMVTLLGRLGELETATRAVLKGAAPDGRTSTAMPGSGSQAITA